MGLWSSFSAYREPLTVEAKKLYIFDELVAAYSGLNEFRKAKNELRVNLNIFSEPKHNELDALAD